MPDRTDLQGSTAIVTGGGTGIGRGIALALAREGARVAVCGRRLDRLESAVAQVRQEGGEGLVVQADISNEEDVERLVRAVLEKFGRIDILINNAGIGVDEQPLLMDIEAWDRTMSNNLRGPFLMARAVLPAMRRQGGGQIINISSESGIEYYHADAAYGLSKHALNDFGEYLQRANQELNIRVNTICPGMVVSEMSEGSPGLDLEKCLTPEDIAELAIWLLTRRKNIKIGTPILIQTMLNPWE